MTSSTNASVEIGLESGCYAYRPDLPLSETTFGYIPSLAAGIAFVALFGLSMLVHTIQSVRTRMWRCSLSPIGCIGEVLGWAARIWGLACPFNIQAFLMQISCLIPGMSSKDHPFCIHQLTHGILSAPNFFTAALYVLLGNLVAIFGRETSMLTSKLFLWIFVPCDLISLAIQAVGGGMASSAAEEEGGNTTPGTNIMVAGILFQTASVTVFVFFAADFGRRSLGKAKYRELWRSISPLAVTVVFAVLCIYTRSIYRAIELLNGWSGPIISTQRYFTALDGTMMLCTVVAFNVIHPGRHLPRIEGRLQQESAPEPGPECDFSQEINHEPGLEEGLNNKDR